MPKPNFIQKRLYAEPEAAEYCGVSRTFLRQSRMNGNRENRTPGPQFVRVGKRSIKYKLEDLDAWIDQWPASDGCEPV